MPYPDDPAPPITITAGRRMDGTSSIAGEEADPNEKASTLIALLDAERLGQQAEMENFRARIQSLEDQLPTGSTFLGLDDVNNFGPKTPGRGDGLRFDGAGNLLVIPASILDTPANLTAWKGSTDPTAQLEATTTTLPQAKQGTAYAGAQLAASGGYGSKHWTVFSGGVDSTHPFANVALSDGGAIGTTAPSETTTRTLVFKVTDDFGYSDLTAPIVVVISPTGIVHADFNMPVALPDVTDDGTTGYVHDLDQYRIGGVGPFHYIAGTNGAGAGATVPNKNAKLDSDGSVTGHAGRIYFTVAPTFQGPLPGGLPVTLVDTGDGNREVSDSATLNFKAANTGPSIDIAPYISQLADDTKYDADGSTVVPWNNVLALRSAYSAMVTKGGRLWCSKGTRAAKRVCMIGAKAGSATFGALFTGTGKCTLDLGNVEFKLAPNQPVNPPATHTGAAMGSFDSASSWPVDLNFNGNGANQKTTDPANPTYGCYFTGLSTREVSGRIGQISIRNVRGVSGSSGLDGNGIARGETFHAINLRSSGGDNITISVWTDDGTADKASGSVYEFGIKGTTTPNTILLQAGIKGVPGSGCRHGGGTYCATPIVYLDGSYAVYCQTHGFNCEQGVITNAGTPSQADSTVSVQFGSPGGAGVFTQGNGDIGIQCNGNGGVAWAPLGSFDIYNWTSISDGTALELDGPGIPAHVNVHGCTITTPVHSSIKTVAGTKTNPQAVRDNLAGAITFSGTCTEHHVGPAVKFDGSTAVNGVLSSV